MRQLGSFRWSLVLARAPPSGKSPPRLDARPPTSVHVPMPAPTTLSELIALYLARCRIEGLSPRTQSAYSETLARFQRSVAAQGVPDEAAAVETATVIRYCETFEARRPATRHRYFREVRCFFNWCVAAGFLEHTPFRGLRNVRLPAGGLEWNYRRRAASRLPCFRTPVLGSQCSRLSPRAEGPVRGCIGASQCVPRAPSRDSGRLTPCPPPPRTPTARPPATRPSCGGWPTPFAGAWTPPNTSTSPSG